MRCRNIPRFVVSNPNVEVTLGLITLDVKVRHIDHFESPKYRYMKYVRNWHQTINDIITMAFSASRNGTFYYSWSPCRLNYFIASLH